MRLALPILACLVGVAHADDVDNYAIVVGSNVGGPGQTELRFAEEDARRVGQLLVDLGGYAADRVDVVLHPTPDQLRARINAVADKINAALAAGKPTRVFFYYSGHARSSALDLGDDELALVELRQRLFQLPAKLTVVVLDACQSGAFSRVKGAQPAADFSFNSRQQLDATGIAVLASSSGSELSQESEQLRSSYFTHHFLVGLRGASDVNRDGLVTIDEAYRYAYHQTLLATAETAVGGQHVTLEVDLKGHGDVPLSYPRAATSTIELPAALEGRTLVEDKRARTVVAETYKAKGAPVRIAVAPGEYRVIVRHGTTLSRCEVSAGSAVDLDRCKSEAIVSSTAKGGGGFERPTRLELTGFLGGDRHDGYTDNLTAFGYREYGFPIATRGFSAMGLRRYSHLLWFGAIAGYEKLPDWKQEVSGQSLMQELSWSVLRVAAVARLEQPFGGSRWSAYGEVAAGLGIGFTSLTNPQGMTYSDTYLGPVVGLGAGFHVDISSGIGASAGYAFDYAPVIHDLIGNTHASGGHRATFAITYGF